MSFFRYGIDSALIPYGLELRFHPYSSVEKEYRRKGLAREALQMMFAFVTTSPTPIASAVPSSTESDAQPPAQEIDASHGSLPLPPDWLTCKISLQNHASIKLFESLGFTRQKVSDIFQEAEMRLTDTSKSQDKEGSSIHRALYWPDE